MANWRYHDNVFKVILARNNDPENEARSVADTKRELAAHLRATPCWKDLPNYVLTKLEQATTFYSINGVINACYDYADANLIWLGFMP